MGFESESGPELGCGEEGQERGVVRQILMCREERAEMAGQRERREKTDFFLREDFLKGEVKRKLPLKSICVSFFPLRLKKKFNLYICKIFF